MKTKRYWLRGGVTAVIVGIIIGLMYVYNVLHLNIQSFFDVNCFPILTRSCNFLPMQLSVTSLIFLAVYVIAVFCFGAIIGFIYGKIKNREKLS